MEICTIFLVEDDPWYGEILEFQLSAHPNCQVLRFKNGEECLLNLHKKPLLVTFNYFLPDMTGEEFFQRIRKSDPELPVIVISSQENISTAVSMLKMGAHDFLIKNDNTKDLLWNEITRLQHHLNLKKELEQLRSELAVKYAFDTTIIGSSQAIRNVIAQVSKAAATNINLSISGENGTGKETVAKAVHYNSRRSGMPFVNLNLSAIPKQLHETELFGHEKHAFPGATTQNLGKLELADKGTIYIEDICELDKSLQLKLLRVLQEKELMRMGSAQKTPIDVRVIVGTKEPLANEVAANRLREDLYYQILGLPIELPPLRERSCDILVLARHFLSSFCQQNGITPKRLSDGAAKKLTCYHYPGNVQELQAIIELAAVLSEGAEVMAAHISFPSTKAEDLSFHEAKTMKEYNISIIQHLLKKYDRNVIRVAKELEIGKSTIYKMLQQQELNQA